MFCLNIFIFFRNCKCIYFAYMLFLLLRKNDEFS